MLSIIKVFFAPFLLAVFLSLLHLHFRCFWFSLKSVELQNLDPQLAAVQWSNCQRNCNETFHEDSWTVETCKDLGTQKAVEEAYMEAVKTNETSLTCSFQLNKNCPNNNKSCRNYKINHKLKMQGHQRDCTVTDCSYVYKMRKTNWSTKRASPTQSFTALTGASATGCNLAWAVCVVSSLCNWTQPTLGFLHSQRVREQAVLTLLGPMNMYT